MRRRITYVCLLAVLVAFYALYPYWVSQYFVVVALLLIPFDLLVSMPGMLTKRISLSVPSMLDIGSEGMIFITTFQKRPFPSGLIRARLVTISSDSKASRRILCCPEDGSRFSAIIDTSHCGLTVFEISRLHITSVLGLFSLIIGVDCRAEVLILPTSVKPKHIVSLPRGVVLNPKPGGGFSENSDLRPYRKGDPIRSIHWKLSAKFDSIIIREPLVPPQHSRLVRLAEWSGVRERDTILGRFRWISDYLLKWDLPYYAKLGENRPTAEITCQNDFINYLFCLLGNDDCFTTRRFRESARSQGFGTSAYPLTPAPSPLTPVRFSWVFHVDAKEGGEE